MLSENITPSTLTLLNNSSVTKKLAVISNFMEAVFNPIDNIWDLVRKVAQQLNARNR